MTKQKYIEALERTLRVNKEIVEICGQNDVSKYMGLGKIYMLSNLAIEDAEISVTDYEEISNLCERAERIINGE